MSTVRFRLDNEQLPVPTAASTESNYEKERKRIEEKSKCTSAEPCRFRADLGPEHGTTTQIFAQTSQSSRPGHLTFLQQVGSPSSHSKSPVQQYSSTGASRTSPQKMDSSFLQYSATRVHPASDYKPLHEELHNGGMERPSFGSVERQRTRGPQYGVVASDAAVDPLLFDATDTDLCLSMVNETRPSYQMKTAGKQPLTEPHLTALIDGRAAPFLASYYSPRTVSTTYSPPMHDSAVVPLTAAAAHSPTSSAYSQIKETSSAYKLSQKLASLSPKSPPPSSTLFTASPPSAPSFLSTLSQRDKSGHSPQPFGAKPVRTFDDFDPDDILRDLKHLTVSTSSVSQSSPYTFSSYAAGTPTTGKINEIPVRMTSPLKHSYSPSYVVSPKARGLAPPPTDQPIRNPAKYGMEANVDSLTIRMMRNMETGYGAVGHNNCTKCGEGIFGDRPGCIAMNKTYHVNCFTCHTCNCKLSGAPFYSVDDRQYCEKDYVETLDKCSQCEKPIKDRILRASGKTYHPQCFLCVSCYRQLDGVPFTVDANGENYCMQCFHEKFAPRCAACHKPIAPVEGQKETTRVVAMDRSYHLDCYMCEDCGLKLSSAIEGHGCYPLDNHLLCKNCNMNRLKRLSAQ